MTTSLPRRFFPGLSAPDGIFDALWEWYQDQEQFRDSGFVRPDGWEDWVLSSGFSDNQTILIGLAEVNAALAYQARALGLPTLQEMVGSLRINEVIGWTDRFTFLHGYPEYAPYFRQGIYDVFLIQNALAEGIDPQLAASMSV